MHPSSSVASGIGSTWSCRHDKTCSAQVLGEVGLALWWPVLFADPHSKDVTVQYTAGSLGMGKTAGCTGGGQQLSAGCLVFWHYYGLALSSVTFCGAWSKHLRHDWVFLKDGKSSRNCGFDFPLLWWGLTAGSLAEAVLVICSCAFCTG